MNRLNLSFARSPRLLAVPFVAALAACGTGAQTPPSVRDVRPDQVELGDQLEIEGRGFDTADGTDTQVALDGAFQGVAGAASTDRIKQISPAESILYLSGKAVAPDRVLIDVDTVLEDELGGAHVAFRGRVEVFQRRPGEAASRLVADSGAVPYRIDLFPPSLRKLGYGLVRHFNEDRLQRWLGLWLKTSPAGLQVVAVRAPFSATDFLHTYDSPPFDSRVTRDEAVSKGFPASTFDRIDRNHDGVITLHEAERYESWSNQGVDAGATAGLQAGDIVLTVDGAPVRTMHDFAEAWQHPGDKAELTLARTAGVAGQAPAILRASLPRSGAPLDIPEGFLLAGVLLAGALLILLPTPIFGGLIVVWERKIAGRMQSRVGPNRVGPQGWLQWLADGVKLILKEDIVPAEADPILFKLSPYLTFMGLMCTFVVLPFSQVLIISNMNVGILYLTSVTSLVVVGIIMGGWASNSKWSLLGGMRSAAQIISYELPASLALLSVVTLAGTLAPQGIVEAQGGAPWNWFIFDNPAAFCCFFIYFISALAEGNRTPFDLPEAESELVSGYNTEYSGFRFSIFFLTEWVNLYVIGAVATTIFLGGWQIPHVAPFQSEHSLGLQALSFLVFTAKATVLVFVIIWIRWTLPRFRVDQMMNMCWKYFIPIALSCFLFSALWVWVAPDPHSTIRVAVRWAMFLVFGAGTLAYFINRVVYTFKTTHAELNANPFV